MKCPYCGSTNTQSMADEGLSTYTKCTDCGSEWGK